MKSTNLILTVLILNTGISALAQQTTIIPDLSVAGDPGIWVLHNRDLSPGEDGSVRLNGKSGDGLLWIQEPDFSDGIIECDIKGQDIPGRSFVGLAFHGVNDSIYDAVYFRPFNFKNEERSGHSVQYISHPENTWYSLRESHPGKYENRLDPVPEPEAWLHVKIEINHPAVNVYVNDSEIPSLSVNQLSRRKHGWIGFWVGNNSEGSFRNLKIVPAQTDSWYDQVYAENISGWMAEYDVPVVGLGIIDQGEISYLNVFGELEEGTPAPDNTIFNVASITKTVITQLTLKLVEEGKWDLDEPLCHYWVDPDVANDPLHKKLTTYHVLTHQTGFRNWRWNHPSGKLTFEFEPGTGFQYSGEGFEYLRHALENRFGNPIEVLTDSLVFQQLGMTDTRQAWDESLDESRFARWYDTEGNQYENSCRTGASAADDLLTTVKDYCEFGIYVMNGGGLSPELFNRMVGPQSGLQKYRAQGLGWTVIRGLPGEEYLISHGGSDYGVKTLAYFLPESKRGIVMFTNGDNGFSVINNIILSTFDIGNDIYECMYYRPDLPEVTDVPQEILVKYTGTYRQPDGSVSTVALKENVLLVSGGRSPKTLYYPQAANMFFQREWDTQLEFVEDESGMITRMVIYHEGNKYAEAERIN